MSIRDRFRDEVAALFCELTGDGFGYLEEETQNKEIDKLFSIKIDNRYTLAVVDRKAELPEPPFTQWEDRVASKKYGRIMSKAGWVKEEKE